MKEEITIPKRGLILCGTRFGSRRSLPTCGGMGRESLGLESSSTTPVCPWDRANSMAASLIRFGILGSTSSRALPSQPTRVEFDHIPYLPRWD